MEILPEVAETTWKAAVYIKPPSPSTDIQVLISVQKYQKITYSLEFWFSAQSILIICTWI